MSTTAQLILPIDAPTKAWNPRYVAYARAHGRTPEDMLDFDRAFYPGGCMTGFTCWMSEQWAAFRREHRLRSDAFYSSIDGDFDAWLRERSGKAGEIAADATPEPAADGR